MKYSEKLRDVVSRTEIGKKFRCLICPNKCLISPGDRGKCYVRKASNESVFLAEYGKVSSAAVEPIEKKPIYHFMPGSKVFSIGTLGCSFSCVYCQNHRISQDQNCPVVDMPVSKAIDIALHKGCDGVCMTYNEPIPSYEYLIELAEAAHKEGLYFALKTNGYAEKEPWRDICEVTDAVNIDYKADSTENFASITRVGSDAGISFRKILMRIQEAIEDDSIHVEMSLPLYTGSDDYSTFRGIISDVDRNVPVHILKVFPDHDSMKYSSTPNKSLFVLRDYLKEELNFVYVENVFDEQGQEARNTVCTKCGYVVVRRNKFDIYVTNPNCDECSSSLVLQYER